MAENHVLRKNCWVSSPPLQRQTPPASQTSLLKKAPSSIPSCLCLLHTPKSFWLDYLYPIQKLDFAYMDVLRRTCCQTLGVVPHFARPFSARRGVPSRKVFRAFAHQLFSFFFYWIPHIIYNELNLFLHYFLSRIYDIMRKSLGVVTQDWEEREEKEDV